jgi:hypothetical protein
MIRTLCTLSFVVALFGSTYSTAAPMATATIKQTGNGTFDLLLSANTDANFGVANYLLPIKGATSFTHSTPRLNVNDGEGNIFTLGFSQFRSGNNVQTIQAGQSLDLNIPIAYGIGQQPGTLLSLLTPEQSISGGFPFATYNAPVVIGLGTYSGSFASVMWNNVVDNAAVQLYGSNTGRGGPLTKVSSGDLFLVKAGTLLDPVLSSSPVPGAGIEIAFNPCVEPFTSTPISLWNSGFGTISISSITLAGPSASQFVLRGNLPTTLEQFTPASTFYVDLASPNHPLGIATAQVLVNTDAGNLVFDIVAFCPEPSTSVQLCGALAAVALFVRRKRAPHC